MAVVIGESGAWKQVRQLAWEAGIVVEQPADIPAQLAKARQTLLQEDSLARDDLARQQATLEQQLASLRASADSDVALMRARCDTDVAVLAKRLAAPRPWPLQTILRLWVGILRSLRGAQAGRESRQHLRPVLGAEQTLDAFIDDRETEVARRVKAAGEAVASIEAVANSRDLAGAVAELEVIRTLSALPDSYTLLNDVHLTAESAIRFDGAYLLTAQPDHLLVGPTGVYVIETTNWSKTFLAGDDHVDPVEQVKRASFLCSWILTEAGFRRSVRSIVACAGAMPDNPNGEYVAVMPITRLASYVQHGTPRLSPDEAKRVLDALTVLDYE